MGCWVNLIGSLDAVEKRKISCPYQKSNSNSMILQPVN
jgi:hypothetical protein